MSARAWTRHPRARLLAIGAVSVIIGLAVRWRWDRLTESQVPRADYDTQIFSQIADRPLGLELLFQSKPVVVPLVHRIASKDPAVVVAFQRNLSFAAWATLAISLAFTLRRRWTRVAAVGLGVVFLLAPGRVGFTASLLSESINDSLTALVVAGAIGLVRLRGRPRLAVGIATGALGLVWILTRDTNAVVAISAAAVSMIVWRGWRDRRACVAAALVVASGGVVLWSTSVGHAPLPYQQGWYARFTPRTAYPMLDNVTTRAYPALHDALPPELRPLVTVDADIERLIRETPELRPVQDWLADHGGATYARWLLRHPIDRMRELVAARWTALSGTKSRYMPQGWVPDSTILRRLTENRNVLLVLIFAAPLLLRRPRAEPLGGLALCLVASGLVGIVASYYGDTAEAARHCYGAGQQVVLGLFVALVAWLDRVKPFREAAGDARAATSAPPRT